jgi:hypothetical protein
MSYRNASLTPTGRPCLARCIVESEWPLRRAADRFGVSVTTAQRWALRYREHSPPHLVGQFRSEQPSLVQVLVDFAGTS